MYLVPAHPVTLPLHPPHIFRIPQLMYLKRQRDSVPRETAFSRSDSALSVGRHNATERRVSCQRRRRAISPSCLLVVAGLSSLMAGFLGLISETIGGELRGYHYVTSGLFLFNPDRQNDGVGGTAPHHGARKFAL